MISLDGPTATGVDGVNTTLTQTVRDARPLLTSRIVQIPGRPRDGLPTTMVFTALCTSAPLEYHHERRGQDVGRCIGLGLGTFFFQVETFCVASIY